jgi:hypothetical protein
MRILRMALVWSLIASLPAVAETGADHSYRPPRGFVPDAATAIRIAVAVWEPIYGRAKIAGEKPYKASLINGVWVVEGSLAPESLGGVARAEISKEDGRIIRVTHGQ